MALSCGIRVASFVIIGLGLLAGVLPAAPRVRADTASIVIVPIHRAKFLAGQRFDFRVEANGITTTPTNWAVRINGRDATEVFGKPGRVTTSDTSYEQTFDDVTFSNPGSYTIEARVEINDQTLTKTVAYEVVIAQPTARPAKNVILLIGDGMSLPARTAARIVSRGLDQGKYRAWLEMDDMEFSNVLTTSGMDSIATDSANSASAYATGHKSVVNAMGVYPGNNADTNPNQQPRVENIGELVKRTRDMGFGLVTTAEIQDATPAAFVAHTRRRSEYMAIMDQMLDPVRLPDVIMGGGSASLLPQSTPGSRRKDDRDLIKEFEQRGFTVVTTRSELNAAGTPAKLLGLFHLGNMNVYLDREVFRKPSVLKQFTDQPTLMEMTAKALAVLEQNPNGFFLMVEGASIDKQLHPLDWERAIWDTIELDQTVGVVKRWAKARGDDTLIIVTADHAHGMSITGTYWEGDGKTGRDAVRVYQDAGFPDYRDTSGNGFPDAVDVPRRLAINWANHPDYYHNYDPLDEPTAPAVQEGAVWVANPKRNRGAATLMVGTLPRSVDQGVHTVEDVPLTASGPGAEQFRRPMDNTELFFAMVNALGLDARQGRSPFSVAEEPIALTGASLSAGDNAAASNTAWASALGLPVQTLPAPVEPGLLANVSLMSGVLASAWVGGAWWRGRRRQEVPELADDSRPRAVGGDR